MGKRAHGTGSIWSEKRSTYEVWMGQVRVDRKQHQKVLGRKRKSGAADGMTRQEAERTLRTWRTDLEETAAIDAVEVPRDRLRLSVVGEDHCEKLLSRKGRRETTVLDYRRILEKHLVPFFSDVPISEITVPDVDDFIAHQLARGSVKGKEKGKALQPQTVRTHVQLLGAIFNRAMRDGLVSVNPVAAVEMPEVRHKDEDPPFLTVEEVEALVRAARDVDDGERGELDAALFLTAAMTGLRRGEMIALRWRDVDWALGEIRVRLSFRRGSVGPPKSRRSKREVQMMDRVAGELDRHFKRSRYTGDDDPVFCHPHTGKHYDPDVLYRRFKEARDRAGIDASIRFHDLRHTFATIAAASGQVSLRTLMAWMGHADMKTTLIYAHHAPNPEHEKQVLERAWAPAQLTAVATAAA